MKYVNYIVIINNNIINNNTFSCNRVINSVTSYVVKR